MSRATGPTLNAVVSPQKIFQFCFLEWHSLMYLIFLSDKGPPNVAGPGQISPCPPLSTGLININRTYSDQPWHSVRWLQCRSRGRTHRETDRESCWSDDAAASACVLCPSPPEASPSSQLWKLLPSRMHSTALTSSITIITTAIFIISQSIKQNK